MRELKFNYRNIQSYPVKPAMAEGDILKFEEEQRLKLYKRYGDDIRLLTVEVVLPDDGLKIDAVHVTKDGVNIT